MIFVNRDKIEEPLIFAEYAQQIREEIDRLHSLGEYSRNKFSDQLYMRIIRSVKPHLQELFNNKCSYCEQRITTGSGDTELFRPRSRAINSDGRDSIGYYWLTYSWFNYYLSCQMCNRRYKRNRFPVKGPRLEYPNTNIHDEKALILDPCNPLDWEEIHFEYQEDGTIIPLTDKGRITIEVFGLNREDLQLRRSNTYKSLSSWLKTAKNRNARDLTLPNIINNLDNDNEFLGLQRQLIQKWIATNIKSLRRTNPKEIDELRENLVADAPTTYERPDSYNEIFQKSVKHSKQKFAYNFQQQQSYDVGSKNIADRRSYFTGAKLIERIEISNFKGIKHMEFDFPTPEATDQGESWMILIGRNSSGKSSILQAIALALIGKEKLEEINVFLNASKFVRDAKGVSKGYVKIWITNFIEPFELHFNKSNPNFETNVSNDVVMLLAYGSTRILPIIYSNSYNKFEFTPTNVKNLFDPQNQLRDVESWLADTKEVNSKRFTQVKQALFMLLDLDPVEREVADIYRRNGVVKIKLPDGKYEIRDLCDGYQSVIAYSLDIMMTLYEKWKTLEDAEGFVLIDEIGVHLHPSWKIRIIGLLRSVFPRVTFIVTTHDPLCLREARKGEVHIMSRHSQTKAISYEQVDIPPGTPVERLYTGLWFSLDGTMDPGTSKLMKEHRNLVLDNKNIDRERIKEIENTLQSRMAYRTDGSLYGHYTEVLSEVLDEGTSNMNDDDLKQKLKDKLRKKYNKS